MKYDLFIDNKDDDEDNNNEKLNTNSLGGL